MKNLFCLIAVFLFVEGVLFAQDVKKTIDRSTKLKENNYCVMLRDDYRLIVKKAGKSIPDNVTLDNGAIINIDGSVTRKDGSLLLLNIGECVDKSGNRVKIKEFSVVREAYRM